MSDHQGERMPDQDDHTNETQRAVNATAVTWVDADFAVNAEDKTPLVAITLMNHNGEMQVLGMTFDSARNGVKDMLAAMAKAGDDWATIVIDRLASTPS
jgi:hypothetical protein